MTAEEGTAALLRCQMTGSPSPKVQWYRNGSPIAESRDYQVSF